MQNIHIFPIRHHSPASSLLVSEFIRYIQPKLVLIEGPSDADHLIEILTDAETAPPVAILAYYFADGETEEPRYILYPFASYSPEYVALQQAKTLGIPARFIDIPSTVAVQYYKGYEHVIGYDDFFADIVKHSGHRSFEEFWEASFENGGMEVEEFIHAMLDYAGLLRAKSERHPPEHLQKDLFREHVMTTAIQQAIADGCKPEDILVVCGAFHAASLLRYNAGTQRDAPGAGVPLQDIATELTVIPYSYPRLSEQLGYGAGNRAPFYYQKVYEHQGDFAAASLETMVAFMNLLHFKGYGVSLANVIEANRLAKILAMMRDKRAPGLEEIREALSACLLHGSGEVVDRFLWEQLVGRAVGKVSSKIGKTSLQQEFYREVNLRKIPLTDEGKEFILHLTNAPEITTSIFLHRLRLCGIPFARNLETVTRAYDYLSRAKEKWQVQWTPAVDAALVEKSMLGNSLLEVCARALTSKLNQAKNAQEAAEVLLEITICDVKSLLDKSLQTCDALSAEDNDFYSLAKACENLHALIAYISSRAMQPEMVLPMLTHTFNRAVLILPPASQVSDDAVENVCYGLMALSDICVRSAHVNRDLFYETITGIIDSYTTHPKAAGLAASIAYLAKKIDTEELLTYLNQRLSGGNEPLNGAFFLDGFLSLNKVVLARNRTLATMLDTFVQSIRAEDFLVALPVLRRAFSDLTKSELNYFLEHLSAIHNIVESKTVQAAIEGAAEKLEGLDDVSQALDDLF